MATNGSDLVPIAGVIQRQEFGGQQQKELRAETAAAAVAAREQAAVNARYLMALQSPRDVESFRVNLLKECSRPGFAELAEYHRPVGKERTSSGQWVEKIATGPSIHLIRTAVALYKNLLVDSVALYESQELRIVQAYALDLEGNVSWSQTIPLNKCVEKRAGRDGQPPEGRIVVGQRLNSQGDVTYTVIATEDEVRVKQARLVAMAQRENCRSILPRDIIDEALVKARGTVAAGDKEDPDGARRRLIDAFAQISIRPEDLTAFLGHPLDRVSPAELKELRGIFVALREGEATWESLMEAKNPAGSKEAAAEVAKQKIEELGKKKPDGITTPEKATVNKGGGPTTASQDSSGSGEQGAAEQTPEGNGSSAPELTLHQSSVQQYRESIGDAAFMKILGSNGCESIMDVTEKNWKTIASECDQVLQDQRADRAKEQQQQPAPEKKGQSRLKL